jgi:L-malate glycosyltransferase
MRIAVLPSSDLSYNSGSIIQAKRWFAHLRREGHDALLLGSRAPEDLSAELLAHVSIAPEILLHPVVVDRPVSDQEYLASISATLRFLMEQHAHKRLDLVHAQYASFTSYAAAVFATATGVPYLVSSFGRDLAAIEADPEGPLGRM